MDTGKEANKMSHNGYCKRIVSVLTCWRVALDMLHSVYNYKIPIEASEFLVASQSIKTPIL